MPAIDVLWWELDARAEKYVQGMTDAENAATRFANVVGEHPIAMAAALTAGLTLAAVKAADFAAALEMTGREVAAVMPQARGHIEDITESLLHMADTVPISLDKLQEGLVNVARRLGDLATPAQALEVLQVAAQGARATTTDLNTSINLLDKVMKQFNLDASQAPHIMDDLVTAAQHGARFEDMETLIARAGTAAANAGVSLKGLLEGLTKLIDSGVAPRQAVALLTQSLGGAMTGMDAASVAASRLGIQIHVVGSELQITGVNAEKAAQAHQAFVEAAGQTKRATDELDGSLVDQEQLVKNRLATAWAHLGQDVLPIVQSGLSALSGLMDRLTRGSDKTFLADTSAQEAQHLIELHDQFISLSLAGKNTALVMDQFQISSQSLQRDLAAGGTLAGLTTEQLKKLRDMVTSLNAAQNAQGGPGWSDLLHPLDQNQANTWAAQVVDAANTALAAQAATKPAPDLTGTGHKTGGGTSLSQAEIDKRQALIAALTTEVARLTQGATAAMQAQLDAMQQKADETFGHHIPDAVRNMFAQWQAAIQASGAVQAFGQQLTDMQDQVRQHEALPVGPERTAALAADRQALLDLQDDAQHYLDTLTAGSEAYKQQHDILKQIEELIKGTSKAEDDKDKKQTERVRALKEQARAIQDAALGALDIAKAFGIVDDNTAKALDSLVKMGTNISTMAGELANGKALDASSILGALGGVATLVSSIFGPNPQDVANAKAMAANTDAIKLLTEKLTVANAITGEQVQQLGRAAAAGLSLVSRTGDSSIKDTALRHAHEARDIETAIAQSGMSLAQFKEEAKLLGITIAGDIPTTHELQAVLQAIQAADLSSFAQDFTGQLSLLNEQFKIMNITDPIQQLQKLRDLLSDPKWGSPALQQALAGLDLSTPEGRAKADAAIQNLLTMMQQGKLTATDLGGLTADQLLQELDQINQLLQSAGGATGTTGASQQFQVTQQITEVTGDRLAGLLDTSVQWLELIENHTRIAADALAGIPAGPVGILPPPPGLGAGGGSSYTSGGIMVNIYMGAGAGPAQVGAAAADAVVQQVDKALGDLYRRRNMLAGKVLR